MEVLKTINTMPKSFKNTTNKIELVVIESNQIENNTNQSHNDQVQTGGSDAKNSNIITCR